jgi:hypothetical protein
MYRQINFFHPSWDSIVTFNVHDHIGVHDALFYINQYGYIPYNPYGYAISWRGTWLNENYAIGHLNITPDDVIMIVPLQPPTPNFVRSKSPQILFRGKGDGMLANPEAQAYFQQQQTQPSTLKIDQDTHWSFAQWIKNLLT